MADTEALIAELEDVLGRATSAQRLDILKRVVQLFLDDAARYSNDHVGVFDEVITRLIADKTERQTLIELGAKLAAVDNAPANVVARLSSDSRIVVSRPMLEKSNAISDDVLVEIAKTQGPDHLAVIAGRPHISESVTDVLIERGGPDVARKVIANDGARLSEMGFCRLINEATRDKDLAAAMARRPDIPAELEPFLKQALA